MACSCDSEYSHFAWVSQPKKAGGLGDMNIPIVADKRYEIARAYGVLDEATGTAFRQVMMMMMMKIFLN